MKKTKTLPRSFRDYIPFLLLLIVLVPVLPRTAHFNYDYKKGSPWHYETLVAQFDFPLLKSQTQYEEDVIKAEEGAAPYYVLDPSAEVSSLREIQKTDLGVFEYLKSDIVQALQRQYNRGVMADDARQDTPVLFVQEGKTAVKYPSEEILTLSEVRQQLLQELGEVYPDINIDSLLIESGIYGRVIPDVVYDRQLTDIVRNELVSSVSPALGYMTAGHKIISKGEIVTADHVMILDSYKAEYEASVGYAHSRVFLWLGNTLIAVAFVLLLFLAIFFSNKQIFKDRNRVMYIVFVFFLTALCTVLVSGADEKYLYMFPFSLSALYLQAFFKNRVIITVYLVSLLPLLVFCGDGTALYVIFSTAGLVSIYFFRVFNRGWKQFITAALGFLAMVATYFGFYLTESISGNPVQQVAYLFVSSMLSVAFYTLIYLFEKMFNLVSSTRLLELSDTDNDLLREFNEKAPGSYQHSVQVMNMAEAAARAIDANIPLVKAGAMYHDIGKMNNPACFVENEALILSDGDAKYHDSLTPQQSARDIIRHVTDGLEIAEKHRLPQLVKEFIMTHHGDARVTYFYNKYVNEGGDPEAVKDFCYPGHKPLSSEHMILMLCDSIEAASRTVKAKDPSAYSQLVENIVASKMAEGQFDECELPISDLNIIKDVIKNYLSQLYHKRVAYPRRKD